MSRTLRPTIVRDRSFAIVESEKELEKIRTQYKRSIRLGEGAQLNVAQESNFQVYKEEEYRKRQIGQKIASENFWSNSWNGADISRAGERAEGAAPTRLQSLVRFHNAAGQEKYYEANYLAFSEVGDVKLSPYIVGQSPINLTDGLEALPHDNPYYYGFWKTCFDNDVGVVVGMAAGTRRNAALYNYSIPDGETVNFGLVSVKCEEDKDITVLPGKVAKQRKYTITQGGQTKTIYQLVPQYLPSSLDQEESATIENILKYTKIGRDLAASLPEAATKKKFFHCHAGKDRSISGAIWDEIAQQVITKIASGEVVENVDIMAYANSAESQTCENGAIDAFKNSITNFFVTASGPARNTQIKNLLAEVLGGEGNIAEIEAAWIGTYNAPESRTTNSYNSNVDHAKSLLKYILFDDDKGVDGIEPSAAIKAKIAVAKTSLFKKFSDNVVASVSTVFASEISLLRDAAADIPPPPSGLPPAAFATPSRPSIRPPMTPVDPPVSNPTSSASSRVRAASLSPSSITSSLSISSAAAASLEMPGPPLTPPPAPPSGPPPAFSRIVASASTMLSAPASLARAASVSAAPASLSSAPRIITSAAASATSVITSSLSISSAAAASLEMPGPPLTPPPAPPSGPPPAFSRIGASASVMLSAPASLAPVPRASHGSMLSVSIFSIAAPPIVNPLISRATDSISASATLPSSSGASASLSFTPVISMAPPEPSLAISIESPSSSRAVSRPHIPSLRMNLLSRPAIAAHPSVLVSSRVIINPSAPPLPPASVISRPALLQPSNRVNRPALMPRPPLPILLEPNYSEPVKDRYDKDVTVLKKLVKNPNASLEEEATRSRMKKDYITINHDNENIFIDEANNNISFELKFLHRNEAGDLTTVTEEVDMVIGDLCNISKDENGKPKVVLDCAKAKQSIRNYYFDTSEVPIVPLAAAKVLFAEQLNGRKVKGRAQ